MHTVFDTIRPRSGDACSLGPSSLWSPVVSSSPSCAVAHCCRVPLVLYSRLKSPCVPSQFLMTGLSRHQTFLVRISKLLVWCSVLALHFAQCVQLQLQARSQAFDGGIGVMTFLITKFFFFLILHAFCCIPSLSIFSCYKSLSAFLIPRGHIHCHPMQGAAVLIVISCTDQKKGIKEWVNDLCFLIRDCAPH